MDHVRWEDSAVAELAEIWTAADSPLRKIITNTIRQIDRQLQTDPLATSESRAWRSVRSLRRSAGNHFQD